VASPCVALGAPGVAYAVGRPTGGAVARNRVRRRLRAAVREHASLLRADSTYLVAAGPGAASLPYARLAADVAALVERANGDAT
jgi:ribonuclease P protein component